MPIREFSPGDRYQNRWKHVQYLSQEFWRRWISEYLPTITLRQKELNKQREVKVGDMVLVLGGSLLRNRWPLGRVLKLHDSHDGIVHAVDVKTQTGVYKRPINSLSFLEGN